ncbi:retrovirus-related Pol polyprotein from transposon 297 [Trichonephila clavipes]|nr:retrovirus-related Pol polyprotein from transposon 297 [Trichonephila clavipes]
MTWGSSHDFRNTNQSANNQFTNRNRQENWQDTRVETRYHDTSRPQRESNRFGGQGVGDNLTFDFRRRSGQSDHRFNNHGGPQGGSRNGAFRGQNGQERFSIAYRFAIDYRKLNAITKYPRYPLSLIDDLITNIPFTTIMSTLDLKSGYFQLAINPRDIDKTAFITRNGTLAFNRMPFGLSEAALNFQKAIDMILKPVLGRFVSVYMDDVIITSLSFTEHVDHLNQVFTLLRDAGLTLNKDKCHFARDKLKYLGLIISKDGIKTDDKKVKTPGTQNVVADVLSRNPVDNVEGSQISCAALRTLALNSREQLIQEQQEDPELGHIYRYLENLEEGSQLMQLYARVGPRILS